MNNLWQILVVMKIDDEVQGRVSAIVATTGVRDKANDLVSKGALDGSRVVMSAWGHSVVKGALPVGMGVIKEQGDKAIFTGEYFMSTPTGQEAFAIVKALGDRAEWSFEGRILKYRFDRENGSIIRVLEELEGREVSPVLVGAGEGTKTLTIKEKGSGLLLPDFKLAVSAVLKEM